MSKNFLAFDLGASSGRGIIGSIVDGKLTLKEVHRFINGPIEKDGSIYWDYNSLCGELKEGLRKALEVEPKIDGIGIDTWGVDYVFFDKDTKQAKRLPYHYRDSRTDEGQKLVWSKIPKDELYLKSGIQCMVFNTIYQIAIHKEQHAEDFENSFFLPMPDALAMYLGAEPTAEYTHVSTMELLDPATCQWSDDIIEKLDLPKDIFPKIVAPGTLGGTLSEELQKEFNCKAIPIYKVGSHDTASAVAAVPAPGSGSWAYISAGTWALLGAEAKSPIINSNSAEASFTNEGGVENTIRFLTNVMGSWLFQESRRTWNENGKNISFMDMENWAKSSTACEFLINPNDASFFTPGDMEKRIIEFCKTTGQGDISSKAQAVRAIYDSLAMYFTARLNSLEELMGTKYAALNIVGGGTKDSLLMQLTADSLNIPVIAGPIEATAVGNIMLQGIASGELADLTDGRNLVKSSFDIIEYTPNKAMNEIYNKNRERFCLLSK